MRLPLNNSLQPQSDPHMQNMDVHALFTEVNMDFAGSHLLQHRTVLLHFSKKRMKCDMTGQLEVTL